jgi:hypothetical protein
MEGAVFPVDSDERRRRVLRRDAGEERCIVAANLENDPAVERLSDAPREELPPPATVLELGTVAKREPAELVQSIRKDAAPANDAIEGHRNHPPSSPYPGERAGERGEGRETWSVVGFMVRAESEVKRCLMPRAVRPSPLPLPGVPVRGRALLL